MRVLFIFPDLSPDITHYTGVSSFGLAALAARLRQSGHEPVLYQITSPPHEEEFRERVRAARPDVVAFSINSHYARRIGTWAGWAKAAVRVPLVVGGIHATLAPEQVSALADVDFTCRGEADEALPELCDALSGGADPRRVRGFWARRGQDIVRNESCRPPADLDALPDPDLSLFDFRNLYPVRRGMFPYMLSRGCAWQCTYCSAHALRRLSGAGHYWRHLSPSRATDQLARLVATHLPQAPQIRFFDNVFFARQDWLEEFTGLYRQRVARPFSCNLRADLVTPVVARLLADAGCNEVRFGVESGDEDLTRRVLRRGLTVEHIRRAFALMREVGIPTNSYNIVGLPGENLRKALSTARLNAEIGPRVAISFIFYPYPRTDLHTLCAERGWLTGREYDHYLLGVTARVPGFRQSDILFVHRFFRQLVRIYAVAAGRSPRWRRRWYAGVDALLTSPLFPRALLVWSWDAYKRLRHRIGEPLRVRRPRLYVLLGGTDPI